MASELKDIVKNVEQLSNEKKYRDIISLLGDTVLEKHKDATLYFHRGDSWDEMGEYDKAIADYDKFIELKPNYDGAYIYRGVSWKNKGETDRAIADFSKAIDLKSKFAATAYYNRGNSWKDKGDNDKALADYSKAIELKPNNPEAYNNRGNIWKDKGDHDKAIADYNKAVELKADYARSFYNRGILLQLKGELEKAISDYNKYLEFTSDKTDIWAERAKSNITELTKYLHDKKLKEIDDVIKKIKKLLLFNSGCLTHYTSLSVAKLLMLDNKSFFRISEGAFLNDTSEGRELFKFLEVRFTSEKTLDDTVAEPFAQKPFIGSFVEETKHDDLNLWRMYGKEDREEAKGCALTIRADKFIESINKTLESGKDKSTNVEKMTASDDINFYQVAYRLTDKPGYFIVPALKRIQEKNLNKLLIELKKKVNDYDVTEANKKDLEEAINSIAFLFKSDVYRSENELRLVVKGVGFEKKMDMNLTPPRIYIDLVNIRPMVEKITLGPKVERPDEWAAAFYYSYDKEDKKPEILISHLPFK